MDEAVELLTLVQHSYDWENHFPYISMSGFLEKTNTYKGQEGDLHHVFRNVHIEIDNSIPRFLFDEFKRILSKYDYKLGRDYETIKKNLNKL